MTDGKTMRKRSSAAVTRWAGMYRIRLGGLVPPGFIV
jgi:hypothetical protein